MLAFVSIITASISCSDDSMKGCESSCSRTWSLCQNDLVQTQSDFQSACVDTCRNAASETARQLGQDLACVDQSQSCDGIRSCPTIGPLVGPPNFGGFAGTAGSGFGGFAQCQISTFRPCSCPSGATGQQWCSGSTWGPCTCSGTGGTTGCSDTCFYSNNNFCDDGGPNARTARCPLGTDCSDCGVRYAVGGFGGGFGGNLGTGGRNSGGRDASVDARTVESGTSDGAAGDGSDAKSSLDSSTDADASGG